MRFHLIVVVAVALIAILAQRVSADLMSITDGSSTYSHDPDAPNGTVFSGSDGVDMLFGETWILRYTDPGTGNTVQTRRLSSFGDLNAAGGYIANSATSNGATGSIHVDVDWIIESLPDNIRNPIYDIDFNYSITTINGRPVKNYSATITNVSGATQSGSLFNYADYDVVGNTGDSGEFASRFGLDGIRQQDDATETFVYHGFDSLDRREIRAWVGGGNIEDDVLANNGYNLSNGGSPFGPGDMTLGAQWDFTLNNNESITIIGYSGVPEANSAYFLLGIAIVLFSGYFYRRRRELSKQT